MVMPGDELQIGSVVLALEGQDPSLLPPKPDGSYTDPTRDAPRVRVVEGANFGDELFLVEEEHAYTVGRGSECALVIEDREVSREHVKLIRRGYRVFVQDLSSTRGSWLGRSAVYTGNAAEWTRPTMLRVGATVLSLELPEVARRAAPAAQASAPMTSSPLMHPPYPRSSAKLPPEPFPSTPGRVGSAPDVVTSTAPHPPVINPEAILGQSGSTPAFSLPPGHAAASQERTAWKKTGPTVGRGLGMVLLLLVGLAILGGLFAVFSLIE
jgi:predicted component of type VI protein secretion system